jgi:hypothetical protein
MTLEADISQRPPMTRRELYTRGIASVVACWERFACAADGTAVRRGPGVAAAVFPTSPERAVYNDGGFWWVIGPDGKRKA